MSFYRGMTCENVTLKGDGGTPITAYTAKPSGAGPFPGMVLLHHAPGWDEWYREATRKFAHHGYAAISHNLYHRAGEGKADDVAAKVRAEGGVPDAQVIGDTGRSSEAWNRAISSLRVEKSVETERSPAASYSVAENPYTGYDATFSTDCAGTVALGETKTCTVTNDDQPARLTLIKHVANSNGGSAKASDFTLTAIGSAIS